MHNLYQMASGSTWSREETLTLIDIWGQEILQAQLEDCKRNQVVYQKVAKELQESGYGRTYVQCRDNIKNLRGEYRKVKDKKKKTGEGNKQWDYFDLLDAILGHKPATQPPVVVDTSTATTAEVCDIEKELDDGATGVESPLSVSRTRRKTIAARRESIGEGSTTAEGR